MVCQKRIALEYAGASTGGRRSLVDRCCRTSLAIARYHRSVIVLVFFFFLETSNTLAEVSKTELDSLGLFASILGHIGDGNFHESIMYNSKDPKERAAVEKCVKDMVDRALEMEGTCTGEHGIGLGKKDSLMKELGLDTINVMKSIKGALDPHWLMNPGKIMDVPS